MPRDRRNVEEIVATLREMERLAEKGVPVPAAAKELGITDQTYYRWRMRYGSLSEEEAKRLTTFDAERARLRRVIEEQAQDIAMLQDLTQGDVPSAARRRIAVAFLVERYGISEGRACRVVGQSRSTRPSGVASSGKEPYADEWDVGWRDLDEEPEPSGPEDAPDAGAGAGWGERAGDLERSRPVPAPVIRIPVLDDRIPGFVRVRTSLRRDFVWLARDSEMARLVGSAGVGQCLGRMAGNICRLVLRFGGPPNSEAAKADAVLGPTDRG